MGNQGLDGSMACLPEGPNELVADRLELRAVFFSPSSSGDRRASGSRKGRLSVQRKEGGPGGRFWEDDYGENVTFQAGRGQVTFATS